MPPALLADLTPKSISLNPSIVARRYQLKQIANNMEVICPNATKNRMADYHISSRMIFVGRIIQAVG